MEQYETVSGNELEESVKVIGLRAVLSADLLMKIDTDPNIPTDYPALRKYIEAFLTRALGASRKQIVFR